MCGIFGVFYFDGQPVCEKTLSIMGNKMQHRGPDDEGYWIEGSIGIGMRRLSIIDINGGRQPISNEDETIHIVLNGEIYNYLELRNELIQRGHHFKTHSDVECVLHLYEEMGPACLERLNGMFAIALYDKNCQRLWLARDRLGIKPLFYRRLSNGIAFASDLGSLAFTTSAVLDPSAFLLYLGFSYVPEPDTMYLDIKKLGAAEQILADSKNIYKTSYWQPDAAPPFEGTVAQAALGLEELLLESTKLELRSDVPVGVFLSGGVDSSAIAAFAAHLSGADSVKAFTIDFTGKFGEDASYAQKVSKYLGIEHHTIMVDAVEQSRALGELLPLMDEPMSDSAIVPTYMLSRYASELGVKVLLSGAGGDEVFGGYARHFTSRIGSSAWIAHNPIVRTLFQNIARGLRPHHALRVTSSACDFAVAISGTNLEFMRQALSDGAQFSGLMDLYETTFRCANAAGSRGRMRLDLAHYLPNNVLSLTDKATMAASVEGRVPLLDHRVVEFAYSLPSHFNPLNGQEKGLFRRVLEHYLPTEVLRRSKEGFNAPMQSWVEREPVVIRDELLGHTASELKSFIDLKVVESWLGSKHLLRSAGQTLYALYLLNRWIRHVTGRHSS